MDVPQYFRVAEYWKLPKLKDKLAQRTMSIPLGNIKSLWFSDIFGDYENGTLD